MSTTQSTARPKRPRSPRAPRAPKAGAKRAARSPVSAATRHAMIAEQAYLRAEQRGFQGGDPISDWLESERQVDALLSGGAERNT